MAELQEPFLPNSPHLTPTTSYNLSTCLVPCEVCLPEDLNCSFQVLLTLFPLTGLLIECDPSIKSMILKYDEERHDYIVEDLDDENHLVIKESQLENLKYRLDRVFHLLRAALAITNLVARTLTRRSCSSMSPSLNKLEIELSARRDIPYKHRAHRRTNELPEPTYKPTYQTTRFPRHNGHDLICDLLRTLAVWVSIDTVPISIFWHPANVHVLSVCIQDFGRSSTTTSIENI